MVPLLIFAPDLAGRALLAPDDGYLYYLPIHKLTAEAWRAGELPAWNPFQLSGAPLLATQAGAFYPLGLLFLVLPAVYANNLYVVLSIAIAAVGAAVLARRLTGDPAAGVVAGLVFASCGFMYGHIAHQPILAGAAWMPWALVGYERLAERRSAGRLFLAAAPLAMAALTGHTQMFFLTVLVLATYAFLSTTLSDSRRRQHLKPFLLVISGAVLVELALPSSAWVLVFFMVFFGLAFLIATSAGIRRWLATRRGAVPSQWIWIVPSIVLTACGIAAIQLMPTERLLHETIRSQAGISLATSFSFSPSHLILLAFPYLFGNSYAVAPFDTLYRGDWNLTELAGYPGLAALVLAAAGWPRLRRDPRAVALGITSLGALVLALGRSTGLGALMSFTPVYGQLRAWGRYTVVVDLAVAVFAAYGVAHLRSATSAARAQVLAWTTFAALALMAVVVPFVPGVHKFAVGGIEHVFAVGVPLMAAGLAAASTLLIPRCRRLGLFLCCLLVVADGALSFGAFFEWRHSPSPTDARSLYSPARPPPWGWRGSKRGEISRFLFAGRLSQAMNPYFPQVTDLKGIHSASGYDPLLSRRYSEVVGGLVESGWMNRPGQFLRHRSPVLDILRISTVLAPLDQAPRRRPTWFSSSVRVGDLVRYTYQPRMPSAYLVGRVHRVTAVEAEAAAVGSRPFDRRTALIERDCDVCARLDRGGFVGPVTSVQWGTNDVEMNILARRPAFLVVSESWSPGWRATIDGHAASVLRTNALVLGVPVPRGHHRVRMTYDPPGLRAGALVSSGTLAAFALVPFLLFGLRRRRRHQVH